MATGPARSEMRHPEVEEVCRVGQRRETSTARSTHAHRTPWNECVFGGRRHQRGMRHCPAAGQTCDVCGKTNHFASKCRSRRDQSGNAPSSSKRTTLHYAGALENVSGVSDDLFVLTLDTSRGPTQIYTHLDVQQKCIRFQVDTAATCNVLRGWFTGRSADIRRRKNPVTLWWKYNNSHGWCMPPSSGESSQQSGIYTVKPALSDHPTVQEKVVVIDRWSLKQGSLNSGRFSKLSWTVANVVVRMRTINATISHVDRVQAATPFGGALANLRCGGCFKRECGVKARIFLALVA